MILHTIIKHEKLAVSSAEVYEWNRCHYKYFSRKITHYYLQASDIEITHLAKVVEFVNIVHLFEP
jgi:hypothetical protein